MVQLASEISPITIMATATIITNPSAAPKMMSVNNLLQSNYVQTVPGLDLDFVLRYGTDDFNHDPAIQFVVCPSICDLFTR